MAHSDIKNIEGKPTIFPYHVLKHAAMNFSLENKLGEGGFGSVFKVHAKSSRNFMLHPGLIFCNVQY